MRSTTNWMMFRYHFRDENDDVCGQGAARRILTDIKGKPAPHRTSDTSEGSLNNYIMRFRPDDMLDEHVLVFDVGFILRSRTENRWNEQSDEYDLHSVKANDTVFTRLVAVPRLGIIAARDGNGERLSAVSGLSRLKSIVRYLSDYDFDYERTADPEDVEAAVQRLRLQEFTFDVRPFNPHPRNPGDKLHELLEEAGVSRFRGKAEAAATKAMTPADDGIISEAMGLAKAGYGQFALKGTTEGGAVVSYSKPTFSRDREENEAAASRPRSLKVAVPKDDPDMTEEEFVVRTVLELFNGRTR